MYGTLLSRYIILSPSARSFDGVQSHPRSKKWRTKRFPLYNHIGNLLNGLQAQGKGTERVGQVSASPKPHEDNTSPIHTHLVAMAP